MSQEMKTPMEDARQTEVLPHRRRRPPPPAVQSADALAPGKLAARAVLLTARILLVVIAPLHISS
jgi:hypothetical protein